MNAIQALEKIRNKNKEITIITKIEDAVILEIHDNGPGISPNIMQKIFDPFFTNQQNQRNMGLGLSITQSIVNLCQGHISVYSDGHNGTCFVLRFPVYECNSAEE